MKKIRLCIIADHVLVRQMLADVIQRYSEFDVVGLSSLSVDLNQIKHQDPDIIILEISDRDDVGLNLVPSINDMMPDTSIVVLSKRSEEGAKLVLQALKLGAVDYITITERPGMLLFAENHLRKRMIPILKSLYLRPEVDQITQVKSKSELYSVDKIMRPEIIVIGSCIGGPVCITKILSQLDSTFPFPILIAMPMPRNYSMVFARELDNVTPLDVDVASDGELIEQGNIRLAPGGYHMEIKNHKFHPVVHVHRGPRYNGSRPSLDVLFRSAAEAYGARAMGMLFSGRGTDGVAGARLIANKGGLILIEDPVTAQVPELPMAAINAGFPHFICPFEEMSSLLFDLTYQDSSNIVTG